jgi:hypothetical protein
VIFSHLNQFEGAVLLARHLNIKRTANKIRSRNSQCMKPLSSIHNQLNAEEEEEEEEEEEVRNG